MYIWSISFLKELFTQKNLFCNNLLIILLFQRHHKSSCRKVVEKTESSTEKENKGK